MLVGPDGEAVGSVSGGCVEGAVYELGQEVVASGAPVLQRYGVSDDDAFAVGLTCGGILDVFVETVSQETFPELGEVSDDIEAGRPVAVATVIDHPDPAWVGRRLVVRPEDADRMPTGSLGSDRARRRRGRRRPRPARGRSHRDAHLRARRGAPRGGPAGLRRRLRPPPPDARLRRHRLRGRGRPRRFLPRLPGDGVRRPTGLRHGLPLPGRRRGRRRVAAPLPGGGGGGGAGRRPRGGVRAHP